jgi:hypothetical protein
VCQIDTCYSDWKKGSKGVLIIVTINRGTDTEVKRWPLLVEEMEDLARLQNEIMDNPGISVD